MKKLTYILTAMVLLVVSACDVELPFPEFQDLKYGAIPRLQSGPTGEFNYFNPAGSSVSFTVDFYDENQGKNVASYSWKVGFIDRTNNGANNKAAVPLLTIPASAFTTTDRGTPGVTVTITLQQVLDALGLTIEETNGGDTFEFFGTVTKTDGSTFDRNNTADNLEGQAAFRAFFYFRQNLVCPSALAGEYTATTTGTSTDPCCPDETTLENQTVTLVSKGSGVYEISDWSAGLYQEWYDVYGITPDYVAGGGMKGTITDACGKISGSFTEPFGTTTTVTGSVTNGVITYTWKNGYDDTATVTLTKK